MDGGYTCETCHNVYNDLRLLNIHREGYCLTKETQYIRSCLHTFFPSQGNPSETRASTAISSESTFSQFPSFPAATIQDIRAKQRQKLDELLGRLSKPPPIPPRGETLDVDNSAPFLSSTPQPSPTGFHHRSLFSSLENPLLSSEISKTQLSRKNSVLFRPPPSLGSPSAGAPLLAQVLYDETTPELPLGIYDLTLYDIQGFEPLVPLEDIQIVFHFLNTPILSPPETEAGSPGKHHLGKAAYLPFRPPPLVDILVPFSDDIQKTFLPLLSTSNRSLIKDTSTKLLFTTPPPAHQPVVIRIPKKESGHMVVMIECAYAAYTIIWAVASLSQVGWHKIPLRFPPLSLPAVQKDATKLLLGENSFLTFHLALTAPRELRRASFLDLTQSNSVYQSGSMVNGVPKPLSRTEFVQLPFSVADFTLQMEALKSAGSYKGAVEKLVEFMPLFEEGVVPESLFSGHNETGFFSDFYIRNSVQQRFSGEEEKSNVLLQSGTMDLGAAASAHSASTAKSERDRRWSDKLDSKESSGMSQLKLGMMDSTPISLPASASEKREGSYFEEQSNPISIGSRLSKSYSLSQAPHPAPLRSSLNASECKSFKQDTALVCLRSDPLNLNFPLDFLPTIPIYTPTMCEEYDEEEWNEKVGAFYLSIDVDACVLFGLALGSDNPPEISIPIGGGSLKNPIGKFCLDGIVTSFLDAVAVRILVYYSNVRCENTNHILWDLKSPKFFLREPNHIAYPKPDSMTIEPIFASEYDIHVTANSLVICILECLDDQQTYYTMGHVVLPINLDFIEANLLNRIVAYDPRPPAFRRFENVNFDELWKEHLEMIQHGTFDQKFEIARSLYLHKNIENVMASPIFYVPCAYLEWRSSSNSAEPFFEFPNQPSLTLQELLIKQDRNNVKLRSFSEMGFATAENMSEAFSKATQRPIGQSLSFLSPYNASRGLFIHVEGLRGMGYAEAVYKVFVELPTSQNESMTFAKIYAKDSDLSSPFFMDRPAILCSVPYAEDSIILFRIFKVEYNIETGKDNVKQIAWTIGKLFEKNDCLRQGRFQLPLLSGFPPMELLEELKSNSMGVVFSQWMSAEKGKKPRLRYYHPYAILTYATGDAARLPEISVPSMHYPAPRVLLIPENRKKRFPLDPTQGIEEPYRNLSSLCSTRISPVNYMKATNKALQNFLITRQGVDKR